MMLYTIIEDEYYFDFSAVAVYKKNDKSLCINSHTKGYDTH